MKKIAIVSAKFTPGFLSHIEAYYDGFTELGYDVVLNLNEGYRLFSDELEKFTYKLGVDVDYIALCDYVWFTNASIHDHYLYKTIKHRKPSIKIFTVFHEPFRGYLGEWKRCKELGPFIRCIGRHVFARNVLKYSDLMVLPSRTAEDLYKISDYKKNNKYTILPLLFTDHHKDYENIERKYISFIGNASKSKGYPDYLNFIIEDSKHNNYRMYQIASKYPIIDNLPDECKSLIEENRLIVNDNHPLSNAEINTAYASSQCVWLGYRENTQSGVICKAQMFGAPCIATRAGEFKTALDESTAVFINDIEDYDEINNALLKIESETSSYTKHARESYLNKYDYKSYLKALSDCVARV